MHQSIPVAPIPLGYSGVFAPLISPLYSIRFMKNFDSQNLPYLLFTQWYRLVHRVIRIKTQKMPFYVIHEHISTHNKTRLSVHPYILKTEFL